MLSQLFAYISLGCAVSVDIPEQNNSSDNQPSFMNIPYNIYKTRERQTLIGRKMIEKVLILENIYEIISILEGGYNKYVDVSTKDIGASICWENVFTDEKEDEIKMKAITNKLADDFGIRLKLIIEGLQLNICKCYTGGLINEFYSLEMLNDLEFLAEICVDHFLACEYEMVEIVTKLLHVYFLEAAVLKDKRANNKTKEITFSIRRRVKKLRKLTNPKFKSLVILNNIILGLPNYSLPCVAIYFNPNTKNSFKNNIFDCHESIKRTDQDKLFLREQPRFLSEKYAHFINMKYIYKALGELKNSWISHKYTIHECSYILYLYVIAFSFENISLTDQFLHYKYSEYIKSLLKIQSENNYKLSAFLICILPVDFGDVLDKWYSGDRSFILRNCYLNFIKIADYRKHLLSKNTRKSFINLSMLVPEEGLRIIKAVIHCYKSYIDYHIAQAKKNELKIGYDLESLHDICNIITSHFENMNCNVFGNDIVKYVKLCRFLKNLSHSALQCEKETIFLSDYPHILEFYNKCHKTGLKINCINNICFVLGKSSDGTALELLPETYYYAKTYQFINAVNVYLGHLKNIKYEKFTYDEETDEILEYIMRCVIKIKQGNYDPQLLVSSLDNLTDLNVNTNKNTSVFGIYITVIEGCCWPKRNFCINVDYSDNIETDTSYSLRELYTKKYITIENLKRLYDVCCKLSSLKTKEEFDILRLGALFWKYKSQKYEILSDIMCHAFKQLEIVKSNNAADHHVLKVTKFLFMSFRSIYYENLERMIVLMLNIASIYAIKGQTFRLTRDVGLYELFDSRIKSYFIIVRSRKIVENIIATSINNSVIRRCIYELLSKYSKFLDFNMKEVIRNTESSIIHNFGKQLSITLEVIESVDCDLVISSELLKFISKTISIVDDIAKNDIILLLATIFDKLQNMMIDCCKGCPSLADTLAHCKIIFFMARSVFVNYRSLGSNISCDFIDLCRHSMVEISKNLRFPRILEKIEISKYKNLRDGFLMLIADHDAISRWEILSFMIHSRTNGIKKYENCKDVIKFIMIISHVSRHVKSFIIVPPYYDFMYRAYFTLVKFLIAIEGNADELSSVDANTILEIYSLSNKDNALIGSFSHRILKELIKSKKCIICLCEIYDNIHCETVEFIV